MSAFSDRTVIVRGCGAQASMAHAVAAGFAAQGANLVAVGPHASVNDYARSLAVEADAGVMALRLAHEDTPAVRKAVQDIVDRFGRIDVLVNCSLVARAELLASTRDDDLERTFATCAIESFAWMRECRPHLAIAHGSVINFGSRLAISTSISSAHRRRPRSSSIGFVNSPMRKTRRFRLWGVMRSPRHMMVSWIPASFSRARRGIM